MSLRRKNLYEIRFLPLLFLANILDRINLVIFGIIHEHVIFFIKCHFLDSCELCVNHTHSLCSLKDVQMRSIPPDHLRSEISF